MPLFFGQTPAPQTNFAPGYRAPLLSGEAGTAQTIAVMRQLVDQAQSDAEFVSFAVNIARSAPAYDELGEAEALYRWVKGNIRYTKDPVTKETLFPPSELLKRRAGDCDDISMLLGAMLLAIGYPARLITVAANPGNPQEFSHVYTEGEVPAGSGQWVAMDAARYDSQFGVEPPAYFRKRAWSLMDSSFEDLSGVTRMCGLAGYQRFHYSPQPPVGMGDASTDALLAQALTETPALIAVASGGSSSYNPQTGQNAVNAAPNPYSSFATPYTPGYGISPAGYVTPPILTSPNILPLLLIGAVALFAMGGK